MAVPVHGHALIVESPEQRKIEGDVDENLPIVEHQLPPTSAPQMAVFVFHDRIGGDSRAVFRGGGGEFPSVVTHQAPAGAEPQISGAVL